jgi:dUTP pyrophosphatase
LGRRPAKLDLHTSAGIFLGYCTTDKNIIYMDNIKKRFKTATHVVFDEAGMTLPPTEQSPAAKVLQQLGYAHDAQDSELNSLESPQHPPPRNPITEAEAKETNCDTDHTPAESISNTTATSSSESLRVKCLSVHATIPTRATDGSAGYDLYSAVDATIQPHTRCCLPLDITIIPPTGTYGQIFSRSGMSAKHQVDVRAGTIDPDYRGNISVLLDNTSSTPFTIRIGDRIAQMVLLNIQTPPVTTVAVLPATNRGDGAFGSTGTRDILNNPQEVTAEDTPQVNTMVSPPLYNTTPIDADVEKPYEIYFSHDPFNNTLEVEVPIKGDHPTLGILTEYCDYRQ